MNEIERHTTIEDIVTRKPDAVRYLMERGIRCIVCGEPIWDTLENAAREKGITDKDIDEIVHELNELKSDT